MAKLMSKSELIQKIVAQHADKMARKDVKAVIELLAAIGYRELNKSGALSCPDLPNSLSSRNRRQRAKWNQSIHEGANDIQGKAGPEGRQGAAGQGR